jgi:hypothetical protein
MAAKRVRRWVGAIVLSPALLLAVLASPAAADSVTIGQLAPGTPPANCTLGPSDLFQPVGATAAVPSFAPNTTASITSWSTNAAAGNNQTIKFKVFRNMGGLSYMVVGHDGPRALTPGTVNTFSGISIPVKPGDVLGLNDQDATAAPIACYFPVPGAGLTAATGDLADGASGSFACCVVDRGVNLTAVVSFVTVTGQRAAALKKCKKKHSKKARRKCRKKAKKLPA